MSIELKTAKKYYKLQGDGLRSGDVTRPAIVACGRYRHRRKLSNQDVIEKYGLIITAEEITTKTGILSRGDDPGPTSVFQAEALTEAFKTGKIDPLEMRYCMANSTTDDHPTPGNAAIVVDKVGAANAIPSTRKNACSGFVIDIDDTIDKIGSGRWDDVGIVEGEFYDYIVEPEDESQMYSFARGAGAVYFRRVPVPVWSRLPQPVVHLDADTKNWQDIMVKAGGSAYPITKEALINHDDKLTLKGKKNFLKSVDGMPRNIKAVLKTAHLRIEDVDVFFLQGNLRMIEKVAHQLKIPMEKVFSNIDQEGYIGCASIPVAFCDALESKPPKLFPGAIVCGASGSDSGGKSGAFLLEWEGNVKLKKPWWRKMQILLERTRRKFIRKYFRMPFQLVPATANLTVDSLPESDDP